MDVLIATGAIIRATGRGVSTVGSTPKFIDGISFSHQDLNVPPFSIFFIRELPEAWLENS
jgi:hypothetical protein